MSINRNNYELFFIDYIDGKLSAEEVAELMLFIAAHPDLKEELNNFELSPVLEQTNLEEYTNKHLLKKREFTTEQINNALVAELEGTLDIEYREVFKNLPEEFIKNERKLMAATKMKPDYSIEFPNKKNLKRETRIINLFYYYSGAVAACLLIAFGVYSWFINKEAIRNTEFAYTANPTSSSNHLSKELNSTVKKIPQATLLPEVKAEKYQEQLPKPVYKSDKGVAHSASSKNSSSQLAINNESFLPEVNLNEETKVVDEHLNENANIDYNQNLIMADIFPSLITKADVKKELSPADYVYQNLTGQLPERGKENRLMNLARMAAVGLERLTGRETKAQKTQKDCATKYNFKIGGIEIERTIACK